MSAPAASLLRLMWLASPALPVGGFSYSEGLEAAVDAGLVLDELQTGDWLLAQLSIGLARSDLPLVAQAFTAWHGASNGADPQRLKDLNAWVQQTRESAELRQQTEQMGRSLLDWLRNGESADDARLALASALSPAPCWPVVFALAGVLANARRSDTLLAFAWGWAENQAQAAMKAVPLGQAAAQRILTRLASAIPDAVATAEALPDDERQAFAPLLAILSARHEIQYSRLFRS